MEISMKKGFCNSVLPDISLTWPTGTPTTEVFLPLGLPANHSFWMSPAHDWTTKKAWNGTEFPKDHAIKE
jgi:hypothetical protein